MSRQPILSTILFAVCVWLLMALRMGYHYGTDDQVELLPYVLKLHNPSLYQHDLFMQSLCESTLNERSVTAHLLLPFIHHLELACLLFHFFFALVLITGAERLGSLLTPHRSIARTGIALAFVYFPDVVVGADELYYNLFQASMAADALLVWGVYFLCLRKEAIATMFFLPATLLHPLEGSVLFAAVLLPLLLRASREGSLRKSMLLFVCPYILLAGLWMLLLISYRNDGSSGMFNELFVGWRHPHHYLLAYTPARNTFYVLCFSFILALVSKRQSGFLFHCVLSIMLLLFAYVLLTQLFPNSPLIFLQFFKLTKWLKLLGVIAMVSMLVCFFQKVIFINSSVSRLVCLSTLAALFAYVFICTDNVFNKMQWQFGEHKLKYADIDVSVKAMQLTPLNAMFCLPPMLTAFKFYSERSSFVDFKANPKNADFIQEWMRRLRLVYNIDTSLPQKGFALVPVAAENYAHLSKEKVEVLKGEGVTHLVLPVSAVTSDSSLLYKNERYAILAL